MKNPYFTLKGLAGTIRVFCVYLFIFNFSVFPVINAYAVDLPQGPDVQIGDPFITSDGTEMTIDAGVHDKTWIDWTGGFNIGVENTVNNIGPSAAAAILHNDISGAISDIQGALNGNCNVFLLNPSGILFAPTAQINVTGLITSTLMMSQDDFKAGNYLFKNEVLTEDLGSIINEGAITATGTGGVTMIGGTVKNKGIINANLGNVNLVSGEEVALSIDGAGHIQAVVNKEILSNIYDKDGNKIDTAIENVGDIIANGGRIYMETEAVEGVFDTLVNQEGIVRAGSMVEREGKIIITSDSKGIVQNTGTLDVSAIEDGVDGGEIEMRGDMVGQFGEVHADALGAGDGGTINIYADDTVALSSGSITTANANVDGSGGEVIVYSPETALFWQDARIEAKGGSASGDGGFVETSGRKHLELYMTPDASAPNGIGGMWLIDPENIEITGATANITATGTDPIVYDPTAIDTGTTIDVATINTALNTGVGVTVDTTSGGSGDGTITVTGAIAKTADTGGDGSNLILDADQDIIVNNTISSTVGVLNVTFQTPDGNIDINFAITTNGGTFTSTGVAFDNTGGAITTGAGSVTINQTGAITIGANISTDNDIDIDTSSTFSATAGVTITGGGDLDTFTIDALGIDLNTTGGGQLVQTGTGTITLVSTGAANDITLDETAINISDGILSITSAGDILADKATGIAEITADGDVELHATGIGATNSLDIGLDADGGTLTVDSNGNATVNIDATTANAFDSIVITQAVADNDINIENANVNDVVTITGAGGGVTLTDVDMVTEGANFTYTLEEASHNIAITNIDASIGNVDITSAGDVTVTAAGGGIVASGASNITLTSSGMMTVSDPVTTNGGSFTSTGTTFDNTGGMIGTSGGVVTIYHTDNVTVGAAIAAGAAAVNITASGVDHLFDNNAAITGNAATIIADDMALEGGTINVGANIVTLEPYTSGVAIDLGTNSVAAATLSLTDAELDTITATTLKIGATDAGAISVTSALTPGAITNLSLLSNLNVSQTGSSTITVTGLNIDVDTATSLTEANNITTLAANIEDSGQAFTFTDSNALTIGAVDGMSGVTTSGGVIAISTTTGTFTVSNAVAAGAAAANMTAGGVDQLFDNNAAITGNAATIIADDMALEGGTINAGSGIATIKPNTSAAAIYLGTDSGAGSILSLTDAELSTITASGGLMIGSTAAGAITVSGDITSHAGYSNLALITGSTIGDDGTDRNVAVSGNLTLDSATGISGVSGVSNDSFGMTAATLAARTRTSGNIFISETDALTIGSAVNPSTAFNGITTVSNGNIDIETRGGDLTINKGITANGSGTVTIDATGFTITQNSNDEGTISSTSGDITITAGSADATPTNAPFYIAGVLTNQSDTGGDVYLNYADNVIDNNAGDLNIQAQTLYLTDLSTGDVAVFGAGGNEIELDINAMGAILTGEVEFINTGDITFADITTTTGGFTANAGTGTVTFNGDVVVFAGSDLSVTANDIIIDTGNSTLTVSGAGTMLLQPYSSDRTINIGSDPSNPPGGFDLTEAEMLALNCATTVTIGRVGGTGAITIGNDNDTNGIILTSRLYDLTLHGGAATIEQEINIRNIGTFDLNLAGAVTDSHTGDDIIFGVIGNPSQTGYLNITAVGGVGTTGNPLEVQVGNGAATNSLTMSVLNGDVDTTTSDIVITTIGPTTLSGITNNDEGDITIIASSPLTVAGDQTTTGNGNITLTATEDGGNDDTLAVNADVTIMTDQGGITLNAGQDITLAAGSLLQTSGDGTIDLNADDAGATGDGDITMNATALIKTLGTGAITLDADDDLTVTNITSGGAVTIDSNDGGATGIISFNGDVGNTNGTVTFSDGVTLTGDSTVSSTNGNVTFSADISGGYELETNANNGTVAFYTIGWVGVDPTSLIVNADNLTLTDRIDVNGNIDVNVSHVIFDDSGIAGPGTVNTSGSNGSIDFGTALMDAATGATIGLSFTANGSGNVILGTIGSSDSVASLAVTSAGTTTLNGNITADGASGITFANAANVLLANNVTLTTNTSTGDVVLDSVNGAKSLTVNSEGDITLNDDIGGTVNLTSVILNAADVINVTANGDITSTSAVFLHTTGDAATDDINLAANVIGSSVTFDTTGATPGDIVITATQNNTSGSTTFNGAANAGAAITADQNLTFNDDVTLSAHTAFAATNGSIDLNGNVIGAEYNLTLTADDAVYAQQLGNTSDIAALVINADAAEFNGNIDAASVNTTGVGLTTLMSDITITTDQNAGINLGDIDGAQALTLIANEPSSNILLDGGNIGALLVTSANHIDFDEAFQTTGNISVSGIHNVNVNAVVNAGGALTFTASSNTSATEALININDSVTSVGNMSLDADGTAGGGGTNATVDVDAALTAGGTLTIAADVVNGTDTASIDIANGTAQAAGNISIKSDDTISINSMVDSTGGTTTIGDNDTEGILTVNGVIRGIAVTLDADDATGVITIATDPNNTRGSIVVNATSVFNLNTDMSALNNITITPATTLGGASTVTSTSGDVTFTGAITGANTLAVSAANGTATFSSTVGAATQLISLTVAADILNLAGNISTDGGATADVNFTAVDDVVLTGNVIIDTETGGNAVGGDILFKTTGTVTGDYDLDLVATGTTDGTVQIATVDTNSLDINSTNTTTLFGNITADDDVSLDGATDVNLAADVTILGDGSTAVLLTSGDVAGDFDLAIDSGTGSVTLGAAAGNIDIDVNKLTVTSAGTTTIASDLRTDEGMDFGNAADVDITAGVTLYNTDSGTVDLSGGDVDGAGNLTINANATNVTLDNMEITGDFDVNTTGTTTLLDNISTTNSNVAFDGATNVVLGADVTITTNIGAGDIDFSNSAANSLGGGFDLTLTAGTGDVQLDNINDLTSLDVTSSLTTQFVGSTAMNGDISIDATTLINVDGSIVTTGAITLDSDTNVDIDGVLTAGGDIDIDADNNIAVDANMTETGSNGITLTADSDTDGTGNLIIADDANATITTSGNIALLGEDVTIGDTGAGGFVGKVVTTGTGTIAITADNGNSGDAGDFTLATAGSIVDSSTSIDMNRAYDATIGGAGMKAFTGITIDGVDNDATINSPLFNQGSGNIVIVAANNVIFGAAGDVINLGGNASADATGGVLTMDDGTLINVNTGTIDLDANGRITLGGLLTTSTSLTAVTIDSDAADIVDSGDTYVDIDAANGRLVIDAATGVGSADAIETTVASIDVDNATSGNIDINETDAVIVIQLDQDAATGTVILDAGGTITLATIADGGVGVTSVGGQVDLDATGTASDVLVNNVITTTSGTINIYADNDVIFTNLGDVTSGGVGNILVTADADNMVAGAGGAIFMADASSDSTIIDAGTGTITLLADEDITLGGLLTTNGTATAVTITSGNGGIVDGGDTLVDVVAANGRLVIDAETGVGSTNDIETTVDSIEIDNATSGNVLIDETDALTIYKVIQATTGNIGVTAGGTITSDSSGGFVTNVSTLLAGTIALDANGVASDILLVDGVSSATGDITITADNDALFNADDADITSTSGNVTVMADADEVGGGASGILTMRDDTLVNAGLGTIALNADEDITLGGLLTTSPSDTAVVLTSTSGGILDAGATTVEVVAANGRLVIDAVTGVGAADGIETTIGSLDLDNATIGTVDINETDALTVVKAVQATDGNIAITTATGTLTLDSAGSPANVVSTLLTGTIILDANGAASDIIVNDGISNATGIITLTADNDITFAAEGDITSTNGIVKVKADALDVASGTDGALKMVDGTLIDAGAGQIDLDADEDITLGGLLTTYTLDDAVVITTTSGGIVDGGDTDVDIVANTASATVDLDAATGIGNGNALETTIYNLEATNTTTGDIKIDETDAINLVEVINSGTGLVDVTAAGTITTTTVTANNAAVNLYATAGDIFDTAGGIITAGFKSLLKASGIIGTIDNPVNVNIDGSLWVWAGSQQNKTSVILQGSTNSDTKSERIEIQEPTPPGAVIFNNRLMGGGNYGSDSYNGSILSKGFGALVLNRINMFDAYYNRALNPWGYKITSPWDISEVSVIDETFLTGPTVNMDFSAIGIDLIPTGLSMGNTNLMNGYYMIRINP